MAADIQQTPFVKQLAANDRPTRDKALSSLKTYLSAQNRTLTPLDLLKLWKGLFYTMWMSDRPLNQQALANSLASLPALLPPSTRLPFLRAFWQTMAREWTNIDVLRMEKFLLLVRRYVGAMFGLIKDAGWDVEGEVVEGLLGLLSEIPLNVKDARLPNGMRYHVIDVYVDELERVGALELEDEKLDKLLAPLRELGEASPTKAVRVKCKEALEDERLSKDGGREEQNTEGEDDEWDGIEE